MGGDTVGSIKYDARIDSGNFKRDASEIDKTAKQTAKNLEDGMDSAEKKSTGSLNKLGTSALGLAAKLTALLGAGKLVFDSLSDLSALQTARSSFEVLTGSAEQASRVMKDIATFANTTPFEFPEIAKGAKTLLGFGIAADQIDNSIRRIGNAAAATGAQVDSVSVVFGQIFAAGKMNSQDFLQLINNGIALGPEISKELGIPMNKLKDNIEAGKVTFDVFNKALTRATGEGGKYFGATDKLALTLNGRISTLKDTFTGFVGSIVGVDFSTGVVTADGAFARFSDTIKLLTDFLSGDGRTIFNNTSSAILGVYKAVADYLAPKIEALWKTISTQLIPPLLNLWHNVIEPLIPVLGIALVGAVGAALDIANGLAQAIGWVIQEMQNGNPWVWTLAGAFGGLAAAMALKTAFDAINTGFLFIRTVTIPATIASFSGFAALVTSPIVMPAIIVAAAVAALQTVINKAEETRRVLDNTAASVEAGRQANNAALQQLMNLRKTGTPEQQARASKAINAMANGYYQGFATGGFTGTGATNDVAGIVHRGEYVIPKVGVDQTSGLPKAGYVFNASQLESIARGSNTSSASQVIQNNNIYNQVDLDVASRQLAYMVGRA